MKTLSGLQVGAFPGARGGGEAKVPILYLPRWESRELPAVAFKSGKKVNFSILPETVNHFLH